MISLSFSAEQGAVKLYTAWYCPFAQRAHIALLAKGVKFDLEEVDPYAKTAEYLAVNPRGLVPTIAHNGKCIFESAVCIEYVDEAFSSGKHILPKDPYDRAYVRIWSDFINKKIVPHYYRMLMLPEQVEEIKAELLKNLAELSKNISDDGPYFAGKSFGMIDIMLVPYTLRFFILKYYRGFEIPETEDYSKLRKWMEACHRHEWVSATQPDSDALIKEYKRYADNATQSAVAQAIRKGMSL